MEPNITYTFGWLIGLGTWAGPCRSLVEGMGEGRERGGGRARVERGERGRGGRRTHCISFLTCICCIDFPVNDPTE